ncbi:hypothetical protein GOP47_0024011 [Adiantum capillus-veneris]|uniref:Coenzyme Q-binding protein COQ10 START domain-containing protein n=1 Tax=Adiantum capillus-veneris TaxID=13818 RepID=A0A9D4U4N0_ADICA|nr:hypothetical protein GOP47_0024011 [Adiantum capillus-veneris]
MPRAADKFSRRIARGFKDRHHSAVSAVHVRTLSEKFAITVLAFWFPTTKHITSLFVMQPSRSLLRAANRSVLQRFRFLPAADHASFWKPPLLLQPFNTNSSSCSNFGSLLSVEHGPFSASTISTASSSLYSRLQRRTFLGLGDGDEDSGLSKRYEETRIVGYTPEQLFAVVAAVDLYQDFVPWCQRSTVVWRKDDALEAELEIGFKFLAERYISHVELKQPSLIKTSVSQSNLFEYLINVWEFKPGPKPGTCNLHFSVKFQFRSPLYRQVANKFFHEVVSRLVGSFEERCNRVYGPKCGTLDYSPFELLPFLEEEIDSSIFVILAGRKVIAICNADVRVVGILFCVSRI